MCGISGFYSQDYKRSFDRILADMSETLSHRGPDRGQIWSDRDFGLGLGHRRLSILDVSEAGNQPMHSTGERYVLSFNGEIYNHAAIRSLLNQQRGGPCWRGSSDTESLLAALEAWGVEKTLREVVGMFAFALWDRKEKILTLSRDRLGEKPLYYGWQALNGKSTFLFGSELKALRRHPSFRGAVSNRAVSAFLRYNYIPAPGSIYKGIKKLEPGHFIQLGPKDFFEKNLPESKPFWSLTESVSEGVSNRWAYKTLAAVERLEDILRQAVCQQMISDVPLGALLSGGIDSSTITALMQEQSTKPIKTFTIGFSEPSYDEAPKARAVAEHLGTDHHELYVSPKETRDIIPDLPGIYDEPFSDSSQIPTYLVSKLAKRQVSVALTGDGGDEVFCGYNRYKATRLWQTINWLPSGIRVFIAKRLEAISQDKYDFWCRKIPMFDGLSNVGSKFHKLSRVISSGNFNDLYAGFVNNWDRPEHIMRSEFQDSFPLPSIPGELTLVEKLMLFDALRYLPDDILTKVDRASMAVSLETRAPFLNHKVVELAWRLPQRMKMNHGQGKWILRQVLKKYLPTEIIDRPKMGFGVPIGSWLKGPLREWAETHLSENKIKIDGFFRAEKVSEVWAQHISGEKNWDHQLWGLLMFQMWYETVKES
ncbi:MAG: asparagine synthase (glutamine-hydrolyzing) [Rhodospirillaceae bacterium]